MSWILVFGAFATSCGSSKDACTDVVCSGHGTCSVVNGAASCTCASGYVASGATECVANPCASVTCSGHGTCSVVNGAASCACATGYIASGVTECVADSCASVTCSGHGTCSVVNGAASCACATGYIASGATECVADPCASVTCSGHGTCSVVNGASSCACATGYVASGVECIDPCASVDCSGHGTCSVVNGGASCACVSGYLAAGAECVDSGSQMSMGVAPMGWASRNAFGSLDSATIKAQVDALVASGLPAQGYKHVNIDKGWWDGSRDTNGNIQVSATAWPDGMSGIATYIHSKGLLAGIDTDAGKDGCGSPNSGSEGHYSQDMKLMEQWGFDYVKVDFCGGAAETLDAKTAYQMISAAIAAASAETGHGMVLSIAEGGGSQPWKWGAGVGNLWRTGANLFTLGDTANLSAAISSFDQALHPLGQHTGYFNDPDLLTVGLNGLSDANSVRAELSLWAISGAPLIASSDLTTLSSTLTAILGNPELIAIDQDPRGLQGFKISDSNGLRAYGKVLAGSGRRAVVLLNTTDTSANMTVNWANLGLTNAAATVRNIWGARTQGAVETSFSTTVPAKGSVLLTVSGIEADPVVVEMEASANTLAGQARVSGCGNCSGGNKVGWIGDGEANSVTLAITAEAAGFYVIDIAYVGCGRNATVRVNDQDPTFVSFEKGDWNKTSTVSLMVPLNKGANAVKIYNPTPNGWAPDFDVALVRALPGSM